MKRIRTYLFCYAIIGFCAFFSCAGFQMIEKDVGMIQMETFDPRDETFLSLQASKELAKELLSLEKISGISREKLLAAIMLKNGFQPEIPLRKTEILADVLGYERADQEKFQKITSYYKRMCGCIEYFPLANVYSGRDGTLVFRADDYAAQAELPGNQEGDSLGLSLPLETKWQGIVPVICVKNGVVAFCESEGELTLELEDGIRIIYKNLTDYLKEWKTGDAIEGGEILGSSAALEMQFQLQLENGSWVSFNGKFSLLNEEKKVRSVTWIPEAGN